MPSFLRTQEPSDVASADCVGLKVNVGPSVRWDDGERRGCMPSALPENPCMAVGRRSGATGYPPRALFPDSPMPAPTRLRLSLLCATAVLLAACGGGDTVRPTQPAPAQPVAAAKPKPVRIGLALGGGAAKGFAHIGVIKMLEANGITPRVVAGTSAGSVVGALYAGGMGPFELQREAVALDESSIRDVSLFAGGLVKGKALQDYVNAQVGGRAL